MGSERRKMIKVRGRIMREARRGGEKKVEDREMGGGGGGER